MPRTPNASRNSAAALPRYAHRGSVIPCYPPRLLRGGLASPHDTKERARLEVLVAHEAYGLDAADWEHLTGTFTYGGGDTKAELDEIIARSRELW
jgi:hypothetical protein